MGGGLGSHGVESPPIPPTLGNPADRIVKSEEGKEELAEMGERGTQFMKLRKGKRR